MTAECLAQFIRIDSAMRGGRIVCENSRLCSLVRISLLVLVLGAYAASAKPLSEPKTRLTRSTDCRFRCKNPRGRPVCGTDDRTYSSACELRRQSKCDGKHVEIKHRGQCETSAAGFSKCHDYRKQALEQASQHNSRDYIPECKPDGTFAEVQCHRDFGNCWCVSEDGRPIAGSSVSGNDVKCRSRKVKKHRRRAKGRKSQKSRDRRQCRKNGKAMFGTNLVQLFSEEYARIPKPTTPRYPGAPTDLPIKSAAVSVLDTHEKRVIEWKFSELDANKNNELERREIRSLRRMVKKIVKPVACAKKFHKYCDADANRKLSRKEWSTCLGVDLDKNPKIAVPRIRPKGSGGNSGGSSRNDHSRFDAAQAGKQTCGEKKRDAEADHRMNPDGETFIPVCLDETLFRSEQCHISAGICWCVDQKTGKPMPSKSAPTEKQLNCTAKKQKVFKGCQYAQRKTFLTEVLDRMTNEMIEYANNASSGSHMSEPNPDHSLEERAVRWKFHMLDRNRNSKLERREVSVLKKALKTKGPLRKCGRNFLRYCNENSDKVITMVEWIDCMGINDQQSPQNPKRRGPNPFTKYLKS